MFENFTFRAETFKEDDVYVSLAPELGVSSFGETAARAKESLQEAVGLFLEECQQMGTLEDVLEESGYRPVGNSWRPPKAVVEELTMGV
jgi:predicted RNase H-like HicB family nuclease